MAFHDPDNAPTDDWASSVANPTLGGGGGNLPQGVKTPIAAENVKVVVKATGVLPSFQVTWEDELVKPPSKRTVDTWQVRFTSEKVAGTSNNEADWPTKVLGLSRYLNTIVSGGEGGILSYTHTELNMPDGYVIVIGVNDTYHLGGPPSQPWLIRLQSSSLALADDVTNPSVSLFAETVNGADYFNFTPTFTSPVNVGFFKGVQIYWDVYAADGLTEMGNLDIFTGQVGGYRQTSPFRRYPMTTLLSLGEGTLTTVATDSNVVWASGDHFGLTWTGKTIFIEYPGGHGDFSGGWTPTSISSITDADNMTLNDAASASGTFRYYTLDSLSIFFVSVSNYGTRRTDVTSAPSVFIS